MTEKSANKPVQLQEIDRDYLRRLETLSIFAGTIAHDYNNALTVVLGNLSLARLEAQGNSELLDVVKDAESASVRMKKLTERLAVFSRGIKSPKTRFLLSGLINRSAEKALADYAGTFTINIKDESLEAEGDMGQIEKVLENVILNAVEASPGPGGIITVSAERVQVIENLFFKEIELTPGEYYLIRVGDNGPGVPGGDVNKIFDPYYTAKDGRDGLGLALAYAVIKRHRGYINAQSEEDKGVVVNIYLPAE